MNIDDIMDDQFDGCAFAAFIEAVAEAAGPPCAERTRQRAYQYFEEALAEKQERRKPLPEG